MTEVEQRILENQHVIMDALASILITQRLDSDTIRTRVSALERERRLTVRLFERTNTDKDGAM